MARLPALSTDAVKLLTLLHSREAHDPTGKWRLGDWSSAHVQLLSTFTAAKRLVAIGAIEVVGEKPRRGRMMLFRLTEKGWALAAHHKLTA